MGSSKSVLIINPPNDRNNVFWLIFILIVLSTLTPEICGRTISVERKQLTCYLQFFEIE